MKILMVNRKKILLSLAAIMVTCLFASLLFSPSIATFHEQRQEKNIAKVLLKEYTAFNGALSYKLPAEWDVWENGACIDNELYSSTFVSEDGKIEGSIRTITAGKNLGVIAEELKKWANTNPAVKDFELDEIMANKKNGYLMTYTMDCGSKAKRKVYMALLGNGNQITELTAYMNQRYHRGYYDTLINNMIQTVRWNE